MDNLEFGINGYETNYAAANNQNQLCCHIGKGIERLSTSGGRRDAVSRSERQTRRVFRAGDSESPPTTRYGGRARAPSGRGKRQARRWGPKKIILRKGLYKKNFYVILSTSQKQNT